MNPILDARLMSAHTPTDRRNTIGPLRGEVKSVAIFETRKTRRAGMVPELDRAVILESARLRRKNQALKTQIYSEIYGIRANR